MAVDPEVSLYVLILRTDITQRQEQVARLQEVDSAESEQAEVVYWGVSRSLGAVQHSSRYITLMSLLHVNCPLHQFPAIATLHRLANGGQPNSGIEKRIKDAVVNKDREIGALWVRGHTGIPGNEKADRKAALEGIRGTRRGDPPITTFEGLRELRKAHRRESRSSAGFGNRRTEWGKHALAATPGPAQTRAPRRLGSTLSAKRKTPRVPAAARPRTGTTWSPTAPAWPHRETDYSPQTSTPGKLWTIYSG